MHFESLAMNIRVMLETIEGIDRIRTLIVDLAISGKIVTHVQLKNSPTEHGEHVGPYPLPEGWSWQQLPEVTSDLGQLTPENSFTYIDVSGIDNKKGAISHNLEVVLPENAPSRARKRVKVGTVIYSTVRPYLKNIAVVDRIFDPPAIASTAFAILHPSDRLNSRYLYYCSRSTYFTEFVESKQKGVAYPAINARDLAKSLIPLPPIEEQITIVSVIDDLMLKCDELQLELEKTTLIGIAARKSAVNAILKAQSPEELQIAWERIKLNWEVIAGTPESIESLRNLILSLAISGNLTKGFISKDSVKELLDNVGQRINPYPEMSGERFAIPTHWKWVPLASIAEHQLGKMLHTAKMRGTRRKYLRSVNVRPDGTIDLTDLNEMLIPESEIEKYSVVKGDLFVNEGGDVGRNAIFDLDIDFDLAFQNQLHRLRPVCEIESRYIQFVLRQAKSQGILAQMSSGVTIQHFSATALRRFAVPLPPLSEQNLIVEKVNQLMKICDELEREMLKKSDFSEKYARSVVSASA